jgi:UrcA family protein
MFTIDKRLLMALLVLATGMATAAPNPHEPPSVTVNYADLDLTKPAGAKTLYDRLKRAARNVCHPYDSNQMRKRWRECYDQAIANAVADVDRPMLTALHAEKKALRTAAAG